MTRGCLYCVRGSDCAALSHLNRKIFSDNTTKLHEIRRNHESDANVTTLPDNDKASHRYEDVDVLLSYHAMQNFCHTLCICAFSRLYAPINDHSDDRSAEQSRVSGINGMREILDNFYLSKLGKANVTRIRFGSGVNENVASKWLLKCEFLLTMWTAAMHH